MHRTENFVHRYAINQLLLRNSGQILKLDKNLKIQLLSFLFYVRDNISDTQRPYKQILIQDMRRVYQTRGHLRNLSHQAIPNKFQKKGNLSTQSSQQDKEDCATNANIVRSYKKNEIKQNIETLNYKNIFHNRKIKDKFNKDRQWIVNMYSKLQFSFNLSMESLFLAVDIFDSYTKDFYEEKEILDEDYRNIGLAVFMLAIKFQQIYPPTFCEIQAKMKIYLDYRQYVALQLKILKKLNYCLVFQSPVQHIASDTQLSIEKKYYIYLHLQISMMNTQIRRNYSWLQIVRAIKLAFRPLTQVIGESGEGLPSQIVCLKELTRERSRLPENYPWLERKYSNNQYQYMALKSCYFD